MSNKPPPFFYQLGSYTRGMYITKFGVFLPLLVHSLLLRPTLSFFFFSSSLKKLCRYNSYYFLKAHLANVRTTHREGAELISNMPKKAFKTKPNKDLGSKLT